jgi:2-iminobutanoate/2-iminopropanoate deaminase
MRHLGALLALLAAGCAGASSPSEGSMRKAIQTDNAPKPIGPYSQAIVEGDFIFLAGQGPTNPATGKVEYGDVASETKRTFENMKAILEAAGSSLDKVVKCNVYLRDIKDFAAMNEVYKTYFKPPFPARTTIQAGALPGGIAVEIECVARR